jgi:methionyl-tRNA synthetase
VVPEPGSSGAEGNLPATVASATERFRGHMEHLELSKALAAVWDIVGRANQYLVESAPWNLAKDEASGDALASVLYASTETLRVLGVLISPIMPQAAARLWSQLGLDEAAPLGAQRLPAAVTWGLLPPGTRTTKGASLFPRLES